MTTPVVELSRARSGHVRTLSLKSQEVTKKWILVDAQNLVLGRLASFVATRLRGKYRPDYTPHVDCGDYVIIVNAEKVALTGKKREKKLYHRYSGFPGGVKTTTPEQILTGKFPARVVELAVRRMMPGGPLASRQLRGLRVYGGPTHPHAAQQPVPVDLGSQNPKNLRVGGAAMAKQPLTDDIVSKVKIALRPEIDAALTNASARLENSFSKGLSAVSDEISTLARNFAHFSDQAQQQLTVQEKELEELRKFNANAESHRNEQREEMKQLHEMMGRLVAKLDPK